MKEGSRRPGKRAAVAKSARARAPGMEAARGTVKVDPRKGRRESAARRAARAREVLARLQREYPGATCSLVHRNPFQLLVATILSAQCTDARVNLTTPALFARFPDAQRLAEANPEELESLIRSTGFFRSKTRSLLGMAQALVDRHEGRVPRDMDALTRLPGVGRKTANVILGNAFGLNEGIVVDTHVTRLSQRLGFTSSSDAVKIEQELLPLFPREHWTVLSHLFIDHGRAICEARTPKCALCVLNDICPSSRV